MPICIQQMTRAQIGCPRPLTKPRCPLETRRDEDRGALALLLLYLHGMSTVVTKLISTSRTARMYFLLWGDEQTSNQFAV